MRSSGRPAPERVGIRLSPVTPANDLSDRDPTAVYDYLIGEIDRLAPIYIHVIEGATGGDREFGQPFDYAALRNRFRGTYVANNGYTGAGAGAAVESGAAESSPSASLSSPIPTSSSGFASARRLTSPTGDVLWRRRERLH